MALITPTVSKAGAVVVGRAFFFDSGLANQTEGITLDIVIRLPVKSDFVVCFFLLKANT